MNQQRVSGFDYHKLLREAQIRWLKPTEILYILQNHERYPISPEAPKKPPSGSMFLINRRVLRYFRKDGHSWRKKKDGKNLGEAHEKLKVGSVEALNCYYAHGEENPYFQRRSYWMLNPAYEHIVLVHYREVSEGRFLPGPISNINSDSCSTFDQSTSASTAHHKGFVPASSEQYDPTGSAYSPATVEEVSSRYGEEHGHAEGLHLIDVLRNSDQPPQTDVNLALRKLAMQLSLEDDENTMYYGEKLPAFSNLPDEAFCSPLEPSEQLTWPPLDHRGNCVENLPTRHQIPEDDHSLQMSATKEFLLGPEDHLGPSTSNSQFTNVQLQSSCGTSSCEANPYAATFREQNNTDWIETIDFDVQSSQFSSDFSTIWSDQGQFGITLTNDSSLTLSEKQRFSIREISPEWAFTSKTTKVIIVGDFLGRYSECAWAVMFGDIQVPAEIVQEGVLRCHTPQISSSGKVSFCVTSGNRESCSEVREFEFCTEPKASSVTTTQAEADAKSNSELMLLVKLARMILCSFDDLPTSISKPLAESVSEAEAQWSQITNALQSGSEVSSQTLYWILEELLKDKLLQWLSSKQNKVCLLSKQEQGIIHMIAGLGYGWAINPILESGIGINLRDSNGWTALHWAACFGREQTVAALLAAGASAVAVTDATSQDPLGKTAGAIAASYGHTGLAGYLSEADVTSQLSSLTIEENELSKGSAELEAERAVESISQRKIQFQPGVTEDELSLKDSLAAVRNATQAAARIQAAFRAHSFRKRQQVAATSQDEYGMTLQDLHGFSSSSKFQRAAHGSRDLNKAALSIQKKYRGWKGRKDFLILRQHVVKIQAHVRGYQERKKYKEIIWMVSMLEKVILRWRRKGVGLRGYRGEPESIDVEDEEVEDIVKVFRKEKVDKALDQAVSRVLSVVESPTSRQQYRRMLERYNQAKADLGTSDEATSRLNDNFEIIENNEFKY